MTLIVGKIIIIRFQNELSPLPRLAGNKLAILSPYRANMIKINAEPINCIAKLWLASCALLYLLSHSNKCLPREMSCPNMARLAKRNAMLSL